MSAVLGWFFAITAFGSFLILSALLLKDVHRVLATLAIITTLAAIAAAIPH